MQEIKLAHLRAIWLISTPRSRQIRPMRLSLPHSYSRLRNGIGGGRVNGHVGHPRVPAGFNLRAALFISAVYIYRSRR